MTRLWDEHDPDQAPEPDPLPVLAAFALWVLLDAAALAAILFLAWALFQVLGAALGLAP